jgi:hypothetical protein
MENNLTLINQEILANLILTGDVSKLNPTQRVQYITTLCDRVGVDPMTQPFKILVLNGRQVLYADKGCCQQLCEKHNISTEIVKKEMVDGVYVVTVRAKKGDRYTDEDGAVHVNGIKGADLANALMKAVTKSKRRAVLALMGLGMMDESELDTLHGNGKVAEVKEAIQEVKPFTPPQNTEPPKSSPEDIAWGDEPEEESPSLDSAPVGSMLKGCELMVTDFNFRTITKKDGKTVEITDYTVEDAGGNSYMVSKFGHKEIERNTLCVFGGITVSEFKGQRQYMAKQISNKG